MIRFLIQRVLQGVVVLFLVTMVTFLMFFAAPNDVAGTMAGKSQTPDVIASINHELGLDRPIYEQYLSFVGRALHGNLGYDYYHGRPVVDILKEGFPITGSIILGAAILWLAIGVTSGVVSAVRPRTVADRGVTIVALIFYSMPVFVLGTLLLYFLYYRLTISGLRWFPPGGYAPIFGPGDATTGNAHGYFSWMQHMLLPWITLALILAASYTRFTRGSMLEVLGEDYIRTARAKGLPERVVIIRHALRSAITPVVSQFGIDVATLFGGTLVTEQLFSMHGLGWNAVTAINNQDLPVIVGIVLLVSVLVVIANFLVDIGYALLDPRVRVY